MAEFTGSQGELAQAVSHLAAQVHGKVWNGRVRDLKVEVGGGQGCASSFNKSPRRRERRAAYRELSASANGTA